MEELRSVPEHMNSESAGGQGPSTMSTGAATTAAADIIKQPGDTGMAAAPAPQPAGPTVVVKVASQSVPDIVVECQEGWTIKDLKQHLCEQHTLHPSVKEQRLIYSGHLLSDESQLASALRHSASDARPVLHLVCAPPRSGHAPPQQTPPPSLSEPAPQHRVETSAGLAVREQQEAAPASSGAAASSSISDDTGGDEASASADANVNTTTDGVRHRSHTTAGEGMPQFTVPGAAYHTAALQQYYAQCYAYLNYMQMTSGAGGYVAAAPTTIYELLQQQRQAEYMQQLVREAYSAAAGWGPEDGDQPTPGAPQVPDGPPPPPQLQRDEGAAPPLPNGPLDNLGGAVAEEDGAGGIGHDWLDSLYIITRFGILSFFIYFYSTVYRFALIITVTVLIYLYHAGWFTPARTPLEPEQVADPPPPQPQPPQPPQQEQNQREQQPLAPEPQEEDNNQVRQPPAYFAPNNMDDRNNNIPNNNNNNEVDEMLVRDQPYHEQVPPVVAAEPTTPADPPPPSLLTLSWTFLTTFFTSLIPEQPQLL